jgi:hypothetical protein
VRTPIYHGPGFFDRLSWYYDLGTLLLFGRARSRYLAAIEEALPADARSLVDLGCGTGELLSYL